MVTSASRGSATVWLPRRSSASVQTEAITTPRTPGGEREHEALGQQLPDDLPAGRAQRRAHRHLARPRGRARQHQVRDVRARDEQHQPDRAHQDERASFARAPPVVRAAA